jgi:hypothetical protein
MKEVKNKYWLTTVTGQIPTFADIDGVKYEYTETKRKNYTITVEMEMA